MDVALNIKLHENQQRIHESTALNIVVMSGKRFGKTKFALYKLIKAAFDKKGKYWYVAPTYGMAESIAWEELKKLLPNSLINRCVENKLLIQLVNGSTIQLKGADNVDSLRGTKLDGVIFDEAAYINPYLWNNIVRGQLLGVNGEGPGFALFISSPVNPLETIGKSISDWYEKFYLEAKRKADTGDKEWAAFHFTIYDNPLLSEEYINKIREDSTEDNFNVEYLAKPSAQSSQVYSEFDYGRNVTDVSPSAVSLFVRSIDWGINHPTVCLFAQIDVKNQVIYIEDEYVKSGMLIEESAGIIKRMTGDRVVDWTVCDPSLNKRNSQTNRSDKQEFDRLGIFCLPGDNNFRGYDIVKKYLKKGMLKVNPKCKNLIKQFKDLQWTDKVADDCVDAARYLCVRINDFVLNGSFKDVGEVKFEPFRLSLNDSNLFPRKDWRGGSVLDQVRAY